MAANNPKPGDVAPALSQRNDLTVAAIADADERPATPRISVYYSDSRVTPVAFLESVRSARIKSFDVDDEAEAAQHLSETDPTLARTIALLGKGPDAVAQWVINATKASLKCYLPDATPDEHETANNLFDRIVRMSAADLAAKDVQRRFRAQNLLRLALAWLIARRNLSPTDALIAMSQARKKRDDSTGTSLYRETVRLLTRAKLKQLMDFSLIAALFKSAIEEEATERRTVLSKQAEQRNRISFLELELQMVKTELKTAVEERMRLSNELEHSRKDLLNQRQLRALDRTNQAGRFRGFLLERLNPSLSDARDALEFDPPHIEAAQQRIEMAMKAIGREVEKSND